MKTKYIIFDNEHAVVFTDKLTHAGIQYCDFSRRVPTSAGFVMINTDFGGNILVKTYGESISLNLSSNPGDSELVYKALGLQ